MGCRCDYTFGEDRGGLVDTVAKVAAAPFNASMDGNTGYFLLRSNRRTKALLRDFEHKCLPPPFGTNKWNDHDQTVLAGVLRCVCVYDIDVCVWLLEFMA